MSRQTATLNRQLLAERQKAARKDATIEKLKTQIKDLEKELKALEKQQSTKSKNNKKAVAVATITTEKNNG